MHLPSFLWLWRVAAWSMGLLLIVYAAQIVSGYTLRYLRQQGRGTKLVRSWHWVLGWSLVGLTLLLSGIGIVGTLGHFGSLGQSVHLGSGLGVLGLVLCSAWSATQIHPRRPWARALHLGTNGVLFLGLLGVLASGWQVVQKYLPS
ncbi:DUF4079 domain-containing protein [Candidatus Cyanaurora vandensis]|uniref:DUF4079 domain-containing protein n=1 Tax=Candidatus Cyanaurora vandensis TaxID=2714958 RepID=UPI00257E3AF0|nr:DUF4079 domain-containing protein [Candidatus Cyanaurora vandensis]